MIKIYHNPRCSKSRQALEILKEKNIEIQIIEYLNDGLKKEEIDEISSLLNCQVIEITRKNEKEFKEHNLDKNSSEKTLIEAMIKSPKLLQRPIVINGERAVIGRPPEDVLKIL